MKKLIQWLRWVDQMGKSRAEIILAAKGVMADMDSNWQPQAGKSDDDTALLLMRIGLIHLQAVYQGQMAAQNVIRGRQAHLN